MITDEEGKTSGRKERLRGHMGVRTSALSDGCTMGPPADNEYAVEPVGVPTMRPSHCKNLVSEMKTGKQGNRVPEDPPQPP